MRLIAVDALDLAVQAVEANDLVILPTRRWYMVCANARARDACERIFAAKGRSRSKSLAYIAPDYATANQQFIMTQHAHRLAKAFWPGDLALVLPWRNMSVGNEHESVGIPHGLVTMDPGPLGDLARRSRVPIAATTANFSDPATNADGPAITITEVLKFVNEAGIDVAFCIDGGVSPLANHLTIVDCTEPEPRVTRPGVVHKRSIEAVITDAGSQHGLWSGGTAPRTSRPVG